MLLQSSQAKHRSPSKRLLEQIAGKNWYHSLTSQIERLEHLQHLFDKATHFSLSPHCRVLEIKHPYLVLGVENAAWATQVKYNTPSLLENLNSYPEFQGIHRIQSHIFTSYTAKKLAPPPNPICSESAQIIAAVAGNITEPLLKQALLKLAQK